MQSMFNYEHIPNVQIGLLSEIQPDQQQQNHQQYSKKPLLFSVLYFLQKFLLSKNIRLTRTQFCKHRGSCMCSAFVSSTKAGVLSYMLKAAVNMLFNIKKIFSKKRKQVFKMIYSKQTISFGCFVCVYLLIFRALVCGIRRLRKQGDNKQKYGFLVGGLAGGIISSLVLPKETRQAFGLFLVSRAIDITYRGLVEKKIIPDFKYYYAFLYSLMMVVTGGYAYGQQPINMSPDLHKFYRMFTAQNPNDQFMRRIWMERRNNKLLKNGIPAYDTMKYLPEACKARGISYPHNE